MIRQIGLANFPQLALTSNEIGAENVPMGECRVCLGIHAITERHELAAERKCYLLCRARSKKQRDGYITSRGIEYKLVGGQRGWRIPRDSLCARGPEPARPTIDYRLQPSTVAGNVCLSHEPR